MKFGGLLLISTVLFTSLASSCADPGTTYEVRILEKDTLAHYGSPYCAYKIEPVDSLIVLPRYSLVDACGKYQVGDRIAIEINDLK